MQVAANGRDIRDQTFAHGKRFLHKLESGAFVFGEGKDASVVSSIEQVAEFEPHVRSQVEEWLRQGGYDAGVQEQREKDLVNESQYTSGRLEALAMQKGGTPLVAQMIALLEGKPVTGQIVPPGGPKINKVSKGQAEVILADDTDEKPAYSEETKNWLNQRELQLSGKAQEGQPSTGGQGDSNAPPPPPPVSEVMLALQGIAEQVGAIAQRVSTLETKKATPTRSRARKPAKQKAATKPPVQT